MVIEVPLGCKRFLHSKADYPFRLLFKYFLTADRSWTCPSTKIHQRFGTAILLNNVTAGKVVTEFTHAMVSRPRVDIGWQPVTNIIDMVLLVCNYTTKKLLTKMSRVHWSHSIVFLVSFYPAYWISRFPFLTLRLLGKSFGCCKHTHLVISSWISICHLDRMKYSSHGIVFVYFL